MAQDAPAGTSARSLPAVVKHIEQGNKLGNRLEIAGLAGMIVVAGIFQDVRFGIVVAIGFMLDDPLIQAMVVTGSM